MLCRFLFRSLRVVRAGQNERLLGPDLVLYPVSLVLYIDEIMAHQEIQGFVLRTLNVGVARDSRCDGM